MCGIAGILLRKREAAPLEGALDRMLAALRHRGPDDSGRTVIDAGEWRAGLGAARLSILDLTPAGHQPMAGPSGDWIAYNGEVYNHPDLRGRLETPPQGWKSSGDTEVLLHACRKWGEASPAQFRGMFGLAFWDGRRQELVLARDPLGIKPLYYFASPELLVFASEARAILGSGLVPRRLSRSGLRSYLSFGSVESPLTLVEGVRSLPPGHRGVVRLQEPSLRLRLSPFADPLLEIPPEPAADRARSVRAVRAALEDSVRAHRISDVPVGTFLSGGIDSSALVALLHLSGARKTPTFTVTFDEPGFSEARFARIVAERFGTDHREIPLSDADLLGMLPEAVRSMDQPTMDGINTFIVSKAVHGAGIKAAFSGLGGDELFGGYPSFARIPFLQNLNRLPASLRRAMGKGLESVGKGRVKAEKLAELFQSAGSPWDLYRISRRLFSPQEIHSLLPKGGEDLPAPPAVPEGSDPFSRIGLYEMRHYMVNTLLRDTDAMSMASSLEVRVPFLDREVLRAVLAVPSRHKADGSRPKPLLLDALEGQIPEEIRRRRKAGFVLPLERWMRSSLRSDLDASFSQPEALSRAGVQPVFAQNCWREFLRRPHSAGWARPWALHVLAAWCRLNRIEP